jgi:thiamine biosynthesis lipoprotein
MGITEAFMVDENRQTYATPTMKKRLHLLDAKNS